MQTCYEKCNDENKYLKKYIKILKHLIPLYLPHQNDTVDDSLAQFINGYVSKPELRLMFARIKS